VIADQADGDGNVFMAEQANSLANAVFVYGKVIFVQIGSEAAGAIVNDGLQYHQVEVYGDLKWLVGLSPRGNTGEKECSNLAGQRPTPPS
jgi:hypothetical protein